MLTGVSLPGLRAPTNALPEIAIEKQGNKVTEGSSHLMLTGEPQPGPRALPDVARQKLGNFLRKITKKHQRLPGSTSNPGLTTRWLLP